MLTSTSSRVIRGAAASVVCLALAFGTAGVALAGQGSHSHGHSNISSHDQGSWGNHAEGTVSTFGPTSITLKDRKGTLTTYTTGPGTTYFEGKTAGVVGDLAANEFVSLELSSTTPQTVTKVTIFLDHFFGKVTGVSGTTISITGWHNTALTVNEVPGTTTYTSGGAASTSAAVISGVEISAVGLPGSTAGSLNANSIDIIVPRLSTHAEGTVSTFGPTSITLKDRKGTLTTYTTGPGTTYFEGKTAGVVGDLAANEFVSLELSSTTPQTVTKVTIFLDHFFGKVTGVSGTTISITGWHNTALTVNEVPGTTTYTSGGAASTSAAVISGVEISAVGLPGSTAGSLNANSIDIIVPRLSTHAEGTVSTFGPTSITLKDRKGTLTTYTTGPGTTYFEGKTAGVVGDLAANEFVSLELSSTTPQTVTKVTIFLDHFFGKVTGVSGTTISITGWHNTALTVNEVPGTTTYTSGGAASTSAAVISGVEISAVGLPGSTAGSLNANSIDIIVPAGSSTAHGHGHSSGGGGFGFGSKGHGHSHH